MFCKNCGTELQSDAKFCQNCGQAVTPVEAEKAPEGVAAAQAQDAAAPAAEQTQYRYQQQTAQAQYYQPNPAASAIESSKLFGILSIVGAFIFSIAGIVLGVIGMNKVKNLVVPPEMELDRQKAYKLNKIGFILSIVFIGLAILLGIISGCVAATSVGYYY